MPTLNQIPAPDRAELWDVGGTVYVVYTASHRGKKVRVAWRVRNPAELETILGPGRSFNPDRRLTNNQFKKTGVLVQGHSDELANLTQDPIAHVRQQFKELVEVQPWLKNPEMFALHLAATMEGRQPTQEEVAKTSWWRKHNDAQRAWITQSAQDPATAKQTYASNISRVRQMLTEAGVNNAPNDVVSILARWYTRGDISDAQLTDAIMDISDPYSNVKMPKGLRKALKGRLEGIDTTRQGVQEVRDLVRQYLGPKYGAWKPEKVLRWAGKLRNDPDAQRELVNHLQLQLRALYGVEDPNVTWDDLASPWITMIQDTWGQNVNPADDLVDRLIRLNDATEAGQILRRQGIRRGIGTVQQDVLDQLAGSFDLGVRRMV